MNHKLSDIVKTIEILNDFDISKIVNQASDMAERKQFVSTECLINWFFPFLYDLKRFNRVYAKKIEMLYSQLVQYTTQHENSDDYRIYQNIVSGDAIAHEHEKYDREIKIMLNSISQHIKKDSSLVDGLQENFLEYKNNVIDAVAGISDTILPINQKDPKLFDSLQNILSMHKGNIDIISNAILQHINEDSSLVDRLHQVLLWYKNDQIKIILEQQQSFETHYKTTVWENNQKDILSTLIVVENYVNDMLTELQELKKTTTHQLIKQKRAQVSHGNIEFFDHFKSEQQYLEEMKIWDNEVIAEQFAGIVGKYISWKYPIVYFEPNSGELLKYIVSGDPFYVIDDLQLPYENLLKKLPDESKKRIHLYNKAHAEQYIDDNSIGVCVSWNNFMFNTHGKIKKNLQLISQKLRAGGYAIFNYVDAHSYNGAVFAESNPIQLLWKDRLDQIADEFQLDSILHSEFEFVQSPFKIAVYKKRGKQKTVNLINKLGIILPVEETMIQKRKLFEQENALARATRNNLEHNLKRLAERDKLLADLDEKLKAGKENVIAAKLKNSLNHLNTALADSNYNYSHPYILESILHISKLTFSLGNIKDSKNLIKRVSKHIKKLNSEDTIAQQYHEWTSFLNKN